jgi:ribokinase
MREHGRIVCVASYMRDVSLQVDDFPRPGETVISTSRLEGHGGKGSNQAVQAARCGAKVAVVCSVGDDAAGKNAVDLWTGEGIDVSFVQRHPTTGTGLAMILVDRAGENQIVVDPGANAHLSEAATQSAIAALPDVALVVAQFEVPLPAIVAAFRAARQCGALTLLNAAPAPLDLSAELTGLVDILVVNQLEGAALARMPPNSDKYEVATALLRLAGRAVVITLGEKGALLAEAGGDIVPVRSPKTEVCDTTGAGDAFVGAFAAEIVSGRSMAASTRLAASAGSAACRTRGAVASFRRRDELMRIETDREVP